MIKKLTVTQDQKGFSLIEVTVSMLLLLVLMSAVFMILGKYQTRYQGEQQGADLHQGLRSTMELLGQEIGQAGYLGFAQRTLTAATAAGTVAAPVSSVASIYAGEQLLVGTGVNEELVTVTAVGASSFTAAFAKAHANGTIVNALGSFLDGILVTSTATKLQLYGDINGDGKLVYVEYNYDVINARTLSRSVTQIDAGVAAKSASRILLRDLQANPNGTACFQYRLRQSGGVNYVSEVWVTLSTRSTTLDRETNTYRTMTTSSVFSPRSVIAALDLSDAGVRTRLQTRPAEVLTVAQ